MTTRSQVILVLAACVLTLHVPCRRAMSVAEMNVNLLPDFDVSFPSFPKRASTEVDVWSICPPNMSDVACFYRYLRVYALLRKAAEESDRVSMRNIGKRGASSTDTASFASRTPTTAHALCPEHISVLECYDLMKSIYDAIMENLRDEGLH